MDEYQTGEVVFIDQGHPDDNFYSIIMEIVGNMFMVGTPDDSYSVYRSDCRKLTENEKGN